MENLIIESLIFESLFFGSLTFLTFSVLPGSLPVSRTTISTPAASSWPMPSARASSTAERAAAVAQPQPQRGAKFGLPNTDDGRRHVFEVHRTDGSAVRLHYHKSGKCDNTELVEAKCAYKT